MSLVPVMLEVEGRRILVIGGGSVAARRAKALAAAGAAVCVIAPEIDAGLEGVAGIRCEKRGFESADLEGDPDQDPAGTWFGVVVATNKPELNQSIAQQARAKGAESTSGASGAWVAVADAPEQSDVQFVATGKRGGVTVCVHTGGASAKAATTIRDELLAALDPAWPALLDAAARLRPFVQETLADAAARQVLLRRLVDEAAMRTLKDSGPAGLEAHHQKLLLDAGIAPI